MDEEVRGSDQYYVIDGIRTHVVQQGGGETLVLLHGLGGPLVWDRVIDPLSKKFAVVTIDLPGFGDSDSPPLPFSTQQYCEFLFHLFKELRIEHFTLAGLSYGGQIAVNFLFHYRSRADRLILISSAGLLGEQAIFNTAPFWLLFRFVAKHIVLRSKFLTCTFSRLTFYRKESRPPGYCDKLFAQLSAPGKSDAWLNGFHNVFGQKDEFPRMLAAVNVPTLVIWGKRDRTVRPSYAQMFQRYSPQARLVMIPDAAHALPLEKPEEFVEALREISESKV